MVDRIYKPATNARPHLYYSEGVAEIRSDHWMGHDVLWLHLHVKKDVYRQAQTRTSIGEIESEAFWTNVWDFRT